MKPQDQTILRCVDASGQRGNCFAACIASLLEVPIAEVPNFVDSDEWPFNFQKWLRERGFFYLLTEVNAGDIEAWVGLGGYHVINGQGPRENCRHSVVGLAGEMVFDPHPSRAGLLKVEEFGFLIPMDPAAMVRP